MKAKHKFGKKAMGGGITDVDPVPADAGGNKDVAKEAKAKSVGAIPGGPAKKRLDRASGGRVSADKAPMSSSSSKNPITSAGKC